MPCLWNFEGVSGLGGLAFQVWSSGVWSLGLGFELRASSGPGLRLVQGSRLVFRVSGLVPIPLKFFCLVRRQGFYDRVRVPHTLPRFHRFPSWYITHTTTLAL